MAPELNLDFHGFQYRHENNELEFVSTEKHVHDTVCSPTNVFCKKSKSQIPKSKTSPNHDGDDDDDDDANEVDSHNLSFGYYLTHISKTNTFDAHLYFLY